MAAWYAATSAASSPSAAGAAAAGTTPPRYFSTMAVARLARLPKALARSLVYRSANRSHEKLPSPSKGTSRSST
jgi:hypothetical protein